MKKLLLTALTLVVAGCASQTEPKIEQTGFSQPKAVKSVVVKKKAIKKQIKTKKVFTRVELKASAYENAIKESLENKIKQNREITELLTKLKTEEKQVKKVASLKPETPEIEKPENLKPLKVEPTFGEKIYNVTIKPVRRQVLKWNMYINKEVPKYMRGLKQNPSIWVILVTLFAAFIYGILHTMGPGHGKMVVATYFLTHRANIWQGVWLGLQTAFAHVGGAVVLVFATDIALRSLVLNPAKHMYLLKNISFSLIILVGLFMLIQVILNALGKGKQCKPKRNKKPTKKEFIVALSIGCIPCTGSLLILLYAMANGILLYGLLMILFVAFGMALTIISIGLLAILGKKKLLDRFTKESKNAQRYALMLEFFGALFIIAIGGLLLSVNL